MAMAMVAYTELRGELNGIAIAELRVLVSLLSDSWDGCENRLSMMLQTEFWMVGF